MKTLILLNLALAAGAVTVHAQGAQGVLVKQRAKEVVNQSNVRQGVATPAQPKQPAQPGVANPKQQNIALLQADLAALAGKAEVSATVKQRFGKNLLAAGQSGSRPSGATVTDFVDTLCAVLAGTPLESSERARLAVDLNALFDSAHLPADRLNAILSDVQAILQVSGARRKDALGVIEALRVVTTEIQKAPTR